MANMTNFDGDITLRVDVEPGDVKSTAEDIQKKIEGIFAQTKGEKLSENFNRAKTSASRLYDQMSNIMAKMKVLEDSGKNINVTTGAYTPQYESLIKQLNNVTNSAYVAHNRLNALNREFITASVAPERYSKLQIAIHGVGSAASKAIKPVLLLMKQLGSAVLNTVANKIKQIGSAMSHFGRATSNSNNLLQVGFKKLVQYGFGIRTVFLLVKKLRQALIDGFGKLTQYSSEFNTIVSQFVSALSTLKVAFATAFAPIASVALPLLTALMNALVNVMNLIGKFFSALTGKSTFIQAKKVQTNYAESLDKTGKSGSSAAKGIKDAEKAAKEAQKTIAGFDDVEILHDNSDKDTGSGSGGSGGGGGAGGLGDLSGADMFETVPIESKIMDFTGKLRELIGSQNWAGLGTFLGQCINSVFETARDLVSWESIGSKIEFVINAFTTTFNALVRTVNWELIGDTFAQGLNTLIRTLILLFEGIDWGTLGSSIGRSVESLFLNIDWTGIGVLLSDAINALLDTVYGIITNFDFKQTGTKIFTGLNTSISTIKWSKLGSTLAEGINGAVSFINTGITKFNWNNVSKSLTTSLNSFIHDMDWKNLGSTISELLKASLMFTYTAIRTFDWEGLVDAIFDFLFGVDWIGLLATAIGGAIGTMTAVGTRIVIAIAEAIGSAFGSFTSYFQEEIDKAGGDIIDGLFNGIVNAISDISDWVVDNIFTPFIESFKSAFGIASPSTVMKEMGGYIIEGLYKGITSVWKSIPKFFSNGVTSIINAIKTGKWRSAGEDAVNNTQKGASEKWPGVTKLFTGGIVNILSDIKNANWKGTGETTVTKIKSGVSDKWSTISEYFRTGINNISSAIKTFDWASAGSKIVSSVRTGITSNWSEKIYQYIKDKVLVARDYIKNFNWSAAGTSLVTKLKSGISSKWGDINTYLSNKVTNIKDKFYNTNWKNVGESICEGIQDGMNRGWSWVTDTARNIANSAFNVAKQALGINSPSKVFRDGVGMAIPEGLAAGIDKGADMALNAVQRLSESLSDTGMPDIEIPAIAVGKVIPYESGKRTNSVDTTLSDVANMLKYNQQRAISKNDLEDILKNILPDMLRDYISFYIGDEQIARHANAGNISLNRRYSTTG